MLSALELFCISSKQEEGSWIVRNARHSFIKVESKVDLDSISNDAGGKRHLAF